MTFLRCFAPRGIDAAMRRPSMVAVHRAPLVATEWLPHSCNLAGCDGGIHDVYLSGFYGCEAVHRR